MPLAGKAPLTPATVSVLIAPATPAALSNVKHVVEAPKVDARDAVAGGVEEVDGVAVGAEPDAAAAVGADLHGRRARPQAARNAGRRRALDEDHRLAGGELVTPLSAIALANAFELSSILKPVMSTACAPVLVSSIQSAPNGLLPLLHGATSETISDGATAPGEPVSPPTV